MIFLQKSVVHVHKIVHIVKLSMVINYNVYGVMNNLC